MKTLHISAGGCGSRIKDYTSSIESSFPKHLLPIPTKGKTILGEIIFQSLNKFDEILVWASKENFQNFSLQLENRKSLKIKIDQEMTGPLGPMFRSITENKSRTFACAGDFFCNFSWSEFEKFHDSHDCPISILLTHSVPSPGGAKFDLKEKLITSWKRVEKTTNNDLINIGCYIVDPIPEIIDKIQKMKIHKEDSFFDTFIPLNLISGYVPNSNGFNINVFDVYKQLLNSIS